ncbi:serine-rich adhesin for platelets [Cherax quadricarinatus]|uniref:serine-rich adhesin for platelets n=1 Tax=Cherax quadricarinatus TaxID=27406 RepID=UPI00387EA9FB
MVKYEEEETYSFRLSHLDDGIYSDTSTISSTHKQRIDSLFRDKRRQDKLHPDPVPLWLPPEPFRPDPMPLPANPVQEELERMFGGRDQRQRAFLDVRATVQAQIERLFADATSEPILGTHAPPPRSPPAPCVLDPPPLAAPSPPQHQQSHTPSPTANSCASRPRSGVSPEESLEAATPRVCVSSMKYRVDYLGALQLAEKATSLDVLQTPLKDLYYKYRLCVSRGKRPVSGTLQITEAGLKITHGSVDSCDGHLEFTNPFPTIAVWAAVKLVIRKEMSEQGQVGYSYAFLPLICDPEAQDKYNLYHALNVPEPSVMTIQHPPMFACVMRKVGVPKVLECHGFVCQSSEDAIVMAANLYQALLENMRSEAPSEASSDTREDDRHVMSDSEMVPVRPPRKKRSRRSESPNFGQGLRRASSEDILKSHIIVDDSRTSKRRLKRSISERHPGAFLLDPGDVYTRVALPRSKSFMNVTNKYNFHDLLDDVKQKTGLKSVDEVLKQVINPRGMSFSEMDPDQREILLKLALTLSKDEIYQRSKNIMRQQTRGRSSSLMSLMDSDSDGSTISSVLKATKRSFSRLGSRASSLQSSYLKDKSPLRKLVNNKNRYMFEKGRNNSAARRADNKENEFTHMLEVSGRKVAPKTPMPRRNSSQANEGYLSCSECGYDSECSSKCYCSLPRRASSTKPNDKHKEHDSPCDCDTESCAESEKCYCSLKRVKKNGLKMYEINLDSETDTNATMKSIASYKKGYGSHSNLSELESHPTSWKRNTGGSSTSTTQNKSSSLYLTEQSKSRSAGTVFSLHPDVMRKKSLSSNLSTDSEISAMHRSSDGSGYHSQDSGRRQVPPHQRAASTESLLSSPRLRRHPSGSLGSGGSRGSQVSSQGSGSGIGTHRSQGSRGSGSSNQKILLVSAVDPSGKVVYRGASQRQKRDDSDTASILSMKKTAEIAALFSELKLSQTTDLINHLNQSASESEDDAYSSMQANNSFLFSDNIENSLGYLP